MATRRTLLLTAAALAARMARGVCAAEPIEDDTEAWLDGMQTPPLDPIADWPPSLLDRPGAEPITTWKEWLVERERIRRAWLEFLGPWDVAAVGNRSETVAEEVAAGCRRRLIRYATEPDEETEAWLLLPIEKAARPSRGWPGAVVFHSTTDRTIDEPAGTDPDDAVAIGTWLCQRGFVVVCPRCHLWNTSPEHRLDLPGAVARLAERHPGAHGMRKLLHDGSRAVDILLSIDGVDRQGIVAAGHSLGAKETLYLAAFDDRVSGSVFSEGGIGLGFSNWHDPWYLGAAVRDPAFRLDHAQLLALTLPRGMLILGGEAGPGAADGDRSWGHVARALEVGRLERERPRLGLLNHRGGHAIPLPARERMLGWLAGCAGATGG
jgi:dienelactone hydrolase